MKTPIPKLLLLAVALLFSVTQACKQNTKEKDQVADEAMHEHTEEADQDDHDSHTHESDGTDMLALNDGEKWEADEPTNKNAAVLISIGEEFSNDADKTLEDYNKFGNDVIAAINVMIKECTMKGAADEALHNWFFPIMEQAGSLKDASNLTGLNDIASKINQRMNVYHDYFE